MNDRQVKFTKKSTLRDVGTFVLEHTKNNKSAETHKDYISMFNRFIVVFLGEKKIKNIDIKVCLCWQNKLLLITSDKRANKARKLLSFILKRAYVLLNITKENPLNLIDKIHIKTNTNSSIKIYSNTEVKTILNNAKDWLKTFLVVAFYTGLRTGEIMALKWSDIDFENKTIKVQRSIRKGEIKNTTKTYENRVIDMFNVVNNELLRHRQIQKSEWLFTNKFNKPYAFTETITKKYFIPLLKKIGITYKTLYASRHTFASLLVNNGIDITYVKNALGHSNIATTNRYLSFLEDKNKRDKRRRIVEMAISV